MKNSKKTFLKLYNQIDKDKNNMLSREELKEFLKSIGVKITVKESNVLLNYLDENSDGNIGIKEFIDKIKSHSEHKQIYSLFDDEYVPIEIETLNDKIMKYIVDYLVASNISHVDFFNSIDRDNDGFLSRQELNNIFVKTLKLTLNRDEQSSFYNYLDKNRDNKINISEFHSILKPAIEKALALKNSQKKGSDRQLTDSRRLKFDINEDDLSELKSKIIQYIESKKTMLMASFKLKEELSEPGYVTLSQFKNILEENSPDYPLNAFTNKEIDIIIDRFCEKNRDKINFESFINLRKTPKQNSMISSSAGSFRDLNRSKLITKEVFGKIAKVVKDEKINVRNAFKTFDLNGDGFISVDELREAFRIMKFSYSEEDIEEIVSLIGNNGQLDYKKFIEALKY